MPITYLAHQAPVLPLARRFGVRVDGLALCIGSMSPDFAYAVSRTQFMFWAHTLPAMVWFCIPVTFVVSWLTARVLAPVVPDHLPHLGHFRLRDYRAIATHRFGLVSTAASAAFGAWTHIVLDAFTHRYVWFAVNAPFSVRPIGDFTFRGAGISLYRVGVWAAHVGLSAVSVWLLYRYGKARWLSARAAQVPTTRPTARSHITLWGTTAAVAIPLSLALTRTVRDLDAASILVMRISAFVFAGLCLGALAVRRSRRHWSDEVDNRRV